MTSSFVTRLAIASALIGAPGAAFAQPTAAECAQAAVAADGVIELALKNGMTPDEANAAGIRMFTKVALNDYSLPDRDDILQAQEWCRRSLAGPISAAFGSAGAIALAGAPSPSGGAAVPGASGAAVTAVEGAASANQ